MNAPTTFTIGDEAGVKAFLIRQLLLDGTVNRHTAIALELSIAKHTNRADVVTISDHIHCYEIKTKRDNLDRLDQQIRSYQAMADRVSVVAASRHINTVLSRVPSHVGVIELLEYGSQMELRPLQDAADSPFWSARSALDLLPVSAIRARLLTDHGRMNRASLIESASHLHSDIIRQAVTEFLRDRYLPTTRAFVKSLRRKPVLPNHLAALKLWGRDNKPTLDSVFVKFPLCTCERDRDTYIHVGQSFGPVPEDVQLLLSVNPPTAHLLNQCHHR